MKIEAAAKERLIETEVIRYAPRTIRRGRTGLSLFLYFCRD